MGQAMFFDVIARDKASATFSKIGKASESTSQKLANFGKKTALLGGAVVGAGLISFFKSANSEARESQKVNAQTAAVIKSTGKAAGLSATQFGNLATAISKKTGIDDEQIQAGENMLATFTNIRDGLGKNNKIFSQATRLATDLAVATKTGPVATNVLLGKALNDPVKGIGRLTKIGVTFTAQQKKQVTQMVKVGHTAAAQRVILKELAKEFGGSAAAQATAADKAKVAFGNLEEQVGTALLPTIDKLANFTTNELVPSISEFVTQMQDGTGAGGEVVDVLKEVVGVGLGALSFFNAIPGPVKKFGVEVLIAGYALKKMTGLTSGLAGSFAAPIARTKQFAAEMTYTETRMAAVTRVSQQLSAGLMQAAGTGGMVLLADSAHRAGTKLGLLESAAGGALSGAALGAFAGPPGAAVGAAIGGIAGATVSLMRGTKRAGDVAKGGIPKFQGWADAIDQATGALNRQANTVAYNKLQTAGMIDKGRLLGISSNLLTRASLGHAGALSKVSKVLKTAGVDADAWTWALANSGTKQGKAILAAHDLAGALGVSTSSLKKEVLATKEGILATGKYDKVLKGVPKRTQTRIDQIGLAKAETNIVGLTRRYHLTPKQVETILRASGDVPTKKRIQEIIDKAKELDRFRARPKIETPVLGGFLSAVSQAQRALDKLNGTRSRPGHPHRPSGSGHNNTGGSPGSGRLAVGSSGRVASGAFTRVGEQSGRAYSDGVVTGLEHKRLTVKKAFDRVTNLAQAAASKLASLKETKSGFLSTFQADSVFGADLSTTGSSLGGLLAFESAQAQKAKQLQADVQRVASLGLSKSLISQLQAAGSSGADQLHLLAGGSADQIRQFNALNAQTEASLQSAGLFAGNTVRGGSINSDIALAAKRDRVLEELLKELKGMNGDNVIMIDSEAIIRVIKKRNKRKGVQTAGL